MASKYSCPLYDASRDDLSAFTYQGAQAFFSAISNACEAGVVWVTDSGVPIARWAHYEWEYRISTKTGSFYTELTVYESDLVRNGVGVPKLAKDDGKACVPVMIFEAVE